MIFLMFYDYDAREIESNSPANFFSKRIYEMCVFSAKMLIKGRYFFKMPSTRYRYDSYFCRVNKRRIHECRNH